jgi:hypothetical protein
MPRDVPDLNEAEWNRIVEVLAIWGEVHPRRDLPLIQLLDGSELTPADIGRAVTDPESPHGQLLYRVFATTKIEDDRSPPEPLDEVLLDFERDARAWSFGDRLG